MLGSFAGDWADEVPDLPVDTSYEQYKSPAVDASNDANSAASKPKDYNPQMFPFTAKFGQLENFEEDEFKSIFDSSNYGNHTLTFVKEKQIAYVDFQTQEDLNKALELNGTKDLTVSVYQHKPKTNNNNVNNNTFNSNNNNNQGPRRNFQRKDMDDWGRREPVYDRQNSDSKRQYQQQSRVPAPVRAEPVPTQSLGPRPRLNLAPRTKPLPSSSDLTPAPAETRSSALFGSAKPVDTQKKLRELEEKKIQEQERVKEEIRIREEQQKLEREEKIKREKALKSYSALRSDDEDEDADSQAEVSETKSKDVLTQVERLSLQEASGDDLDGEWNVVAPRRRR